METRKKILRLLIEEIVVDVVADKVELVIHWQGGDALERKEEQGGSKSLGDRGGRHRVGATKALTIQLFPDGP